MGTAKAHADLVEHGFLVLFPATEHAEFDVVAYRAGGGVMSAADYREFPVPSGQMGAVGPTP